MTQLTGTAFAIGALSLAVTMFFKIATPDLPMRPVDAQIVVGVCAVAVVSVRWIVRRVTQRGAQR